MGFKRPSGHDSKHYKLSIVRVNSGKHAKQRLPSSLQLRQFVIGVEMHN